MVHEGGPSEGCDTCRLRKVKCSLEKPHCLRCQKAGFTCLGYLRRPRSKLALMRYGGDNKYARREKRDRSVDQMLRVSVISMPPAWPSSDRSTNFFLSQFVVGQDPDPDIGWFNFIPHILRNHEDSAPMNIALEAVSLLSFANRYHSNSLIVDALRLNGRALDAVQQALLSPSEALQNGTFAAILLLCLFGHINGDLRLQVGVHASGMFHLLALRGAAGVQSLYTETFVRHLIALLHLDNNDRYIPLTTMSDPDSDVKIPADDSNDLFQRLSRLWPQSAAISTSFYGILNVGIIHSDETAALKLLKIGHDFGDLLYEATQNLDPSWQYETKIVQSDFKDPTWSALPRKTLIYQNPWTMAIWNAYRITRITLHTSLAKAYGMIKEATPTEDEDWRTQSLNELRNRSLEIVDNMNEDICASIAWCLGDTSTKNNNDLPLASKASLSIAGLRAVANGIYSRPEHVMQARAALTQVAYQFGIKGALV